MDADLLRSQLRKSLVQSQRIDAVQLEDSVLSEEQSAEVSHLEDGFLEDHVSDEASDQDSDAFLSSLDVEKEQGDDLGEMDHLSVMQAWSLKIEQSVGLLQQEDKGILSVHYVPQRKDSFDDDSFEDSNICVGAKSRDELESLGKIYLRVKAEAAEWLEMITGQNLFPGDKHFVETMSFFQVLKSGVLLCQLINLLHPNSVPVFVEDFSLDSPVVTPLHERENISKFLKACHEVMGVPPHLMFTLNDIYNLANMPKVVLSLRGIAQRRGKSVTDRFSWPTCVFNFDDHDDALLLASAEMSKMDFDTVHQIYDVAVSPISKKPDVAVTFQEKNKAVMKFLAKSSKKPSPVKIDAPATVKIQSPTTGAPLLQSVWELGKWLSSIGMESYLEAFSSDGWEEIDTILTMTESDVADLGVQKKGHIRKLWKAISQLRIQFQTGEQSKLFTVEKSKDTSWEQMRHKLNITQDLDDAKAIWAMFQEIKVLLKKPGYLDHCSLETVRSLSHLSNLTEDLARSLVPFDSPVVLDIGWDTIKCGFIFSTNPISIPTIVGRYKLNGDIRKRPSSVLVGLQVLDACKSALGNSKLDHGGIEIRRTFNRGMDSIKDPAIIEWDDLSDLIGYIFREILHTNPERHPVIIVEPTLAWSNVEREKLATMLTETFNSPAFYFTPAAPMVAAQAVVDNAVVLDIGESRSTASVIFNNRLMKGSVVHTPVGGIQLTEYFMQELTHDGFEFKSVFEAQKKCHYQSYRRFMEHELARKLKNMVSSLVDKSDQISVDEASLPTYLQRYLPRVTRGVSYINIGDTRSQVPSAYFSPNLIRNDQFYNGAGLHEIVAQSLKQCTESIRNGAASTLLVCGGVAACPGLLVKLKTFLDQLFVPLSQNSPNIMLACEVGEDPSHSAWYGAAKIAQEPSFQLKWITRQSYQQNGISVLQESSIWDGCGPYPLTSPDTALYKSNRAVTALHDIVIALHQARITDLQPTIRSPLHRGRSMSDSDQASPPRPAFYSGETSFLSPRSIKHTINEVATFLYSHRCSTTLVTDVKLYLLEHFAEYPPNSNVSPAEIIRDLPARLYSQLADIDVESSSQKTREDEYEEEEEDDDDHGVWAMAI